MGEGMANALNRLALCLLAGFCISAATLEVQSASAREAEMRAAGPVAHKRTADAGALASSESPIESKPVRPSTRRPGPGSAKGPYYIDFRARTAASWGHAFVWYGKTSERAVEVAGLTPAGDTVPYIIGHL